MIENYDLEIFTPPCDPGTERYSVRARLTVDISEVLPYLNATLPGALYHASANALTWKKDGHSIAIHAYEIAASNFEERKEAEREIQELVALINQTWERRAEITPDSTERKRPTPMAIFKLLPNTNCRKCSEPTCYSFALKLAAGLLRVDDCPLADDARYAGTFAELRAMVA